MSVKDQTKKPEPNRAEQVVNFILKGIRNGHFAPGQRLSEAEIAEAVGLKRGPIREGLRMLAGEGVIDLQLNKGARIRKLSRRELGDMIGVLATLNGASVRLTVERNTLPMIDDAFTPLLHKVNDMLESENPIAFMLALEAYHGKLHEMSHNVFFNYLWTRLHFEHFSRSFSLEFNMDDWRSVHPMFEASHEALLQGDWQTAERLGRERSDKVALILRLKPT